MLVDRRRGTTKTSVRMICWDDTLRSLETARKPGKVVRMGYGGHTTNSPSEIVVLHNAVLVYLHKVHTRLPVQRPFWARVCALQDIGVAAIFFGDCITCAIGCRFFGSNTR